MLRQKLNHFEYEKSYDDGVMNLKARLKSDENTLGSVSW